MSRYVKMVDEYSKRYKVSKFDKGCLLACFPIFKLFSLGSIRKDFIGKLSMSLFNLCRGLHYRHRVYTLGGIPVKMDLAFRKDDLIGFTDTFWQSDYLAPFDISEVKTLVDLGANKGRTALFFFLNAKIERALLVEANSNLNEYIQRTLVSVLDKVEIIIDNSCVLGKSNQTVNFVIVESSRNSHIKRHDESVWDSAVKTIDVQSVSLHELLDKYNFNGSIDLLKMDIEGAEFDILEHDLEVFKRFKYLCFEVHGETEKRKHFFNKIQSIGFDIFKHPHRNEHPLVEILFAAQKNG